MEIEKQTQARIKNNYLFGHLLSTFCYVTTKSLPTTIRYFLYSFVSKFNFSYRFQFFFSVELGQQVHPDWHTEYQEDREGHLPVGHQFGPKDKSS